MPGIEIEVEYERLETVRKTCTKKYDLHPGNDGKTSEMVSAKE